MVSPELGFASPDLAANEHLPRRCVVGTAGELTQIFYHEGHEETRRFFGLFE